jgi:hypothetical protein
MTLAKARAKASDNAKNIYNTSINYDRQNIFIVQATDALLVYKLNTAERFKRSLKILKIMLHLLLKSFLTF